MNNNNPSKLFSELLGGPLGELISSIGKGVGDAQAALDEGSLRQTLELYDTSKDTGRSDDELKLLNMIRSIGYQPTFYTIPETEVEAQISLSLDLKTEQTSPVGGYSMSKFKVNATPLNAGNVNRFGLQASAMAKLKFKIVPVPPALNNPAEMRVVPQLLEPNKETQWDAAKKKLLSDLGLIYELQDSKGDPVKEENAEGKTILKQEPELGTIISMQNPILITIQIP